MKHPLNIDLLLQFFQKWYCFYDDQPKNTDDYAKITEPIYEDGLEIAFDISNGKLQMKFQGTLSLIYAFSVTEQRFLSYPSTEQRSTFCFALPLTNSQKDLYEFILASYGIYSTKKISLDPTEFNAIECVIDNSVWGISDIVYEAISGSFMSFSRIENMIQNKNQILLFENVVLNDLNHSFRNENVELVYKPSIKLTKLTISPQNKDLPLSTISLTVTNDCSKENLQNYLSVLLKINSENIQISDDKTEYSIIDSCVVYFLTSEGIHITHIFPKNTTLAQCCSILSEYKYFWGYDLEITSNVCQRIDQTSTIHSTKEKILNANETMRIFTKIRKSPNILTDSVFIERNVFQQIKLESIYKQQNLDLWIPKTGQISDIFVILRAKFGLLPNSTLLYAKNIPLNPKETIESIGFDSLQYPLRYRTFRAKTQNPSDVTTIAKQNGSLLQIPVLKECSPIEADFLFNHFNNKELDQNVVDFLEKFSQNSFYSQENERNQITDNKSFSFLSWDCFKKDKSFIIQMFEDSYGKLSDEERTELYNKFDTMIDPLDQYEMFQIIAQMS